MTDGSIDEALANISRRLRINMRPERCRVLLAQAIGVLEYNPRLRALADIIRGLLDHQMADEERLRQGREAIRAARSVVRLEESLEVAHSDIPAGVVIQNIMSAPHVLSQTQETKVLQHVSPSWNDVEREIDADEGIAAERKAEAKSIAKRVWEGVVNKSMNVVQVMAAMRALEQLGMRVEKLASLLNIG